MNMSRRERETRARLTAIAAWVDFARLHQDDKTTLYLCLDAISAASLGDVVTIRQIKRDLERRQR